jgi:uncharacterized protein (DUF58 family)
MPTKRGWAAIAAGLSLWIAARLLGSADLHILAAGLLVLPIAAVLYVRFSRVRLGIRRHISPARVFAGARAVVEITVENLGRATTSFLLLEDAMPISLGRPARLVVSGVPSRNAQTVSYSIVCRQRGRYHIGPLTINVSDPFDLARTRLQTEGSNDLVVYPQVEDLDARPMVSQGAGSGESAVRHLHRTAADFYTMREYVTGDDLRRIHWPSVAKTSQLMIRQDESTRRSSATVFIDNRLEILGASGSPSFERAVSVAGSVGRTLIRAGYNLRLATADSPPTLLTEEGMLEALASLGPSKAHATSEVLRTLRAGALADTTLTFVSAPPTATDVATISRVGSLFGRRLGIFVYPVGPRNLTGEAAEEVTARASAATLSLQRAGWEVHVLAPDGRLSETWKQQIAKSRAAAGSSF